MCGKTCINIKLKVKFIINLIEFIKIEPLIRDFDGNEDMLLHSENLAFSAIYPVHS